MKQLDAQIRNLLDEMQARGTPPVQDLSPVDARKTRNPVFIELGGPPAGFVKIHDTHMSGVPEKLPLRIYVPPGEGPFPALIYFHGGGWVIGNLDTHNSLCSLLAKGASCIVIAVDYRLSPESRFPAAVEDAFTATEWVAANAHEIHVDADKIAVGGDSAGGNLAAVVCHLAREKKKPTLVHQLLVYPVMNLSSFDTESYHEHGKGYILTAESMRYYRGHYLAHNDDALNPQASPLLAESFSDLPPAHIITAEFDVLMDEGAAYARKLKEAGIPVKYSCYEGMIHAFLSFSSVVDAARDAINEATSVLRVAFQK
jgi:acetyl esterase